MGMFSPIRIGTWWISSEKDPRWAATGRSYVGGFQMSAEARQAFEELKEKYGEPPDDVEHGYMKD